MAEPSAIEKELEKALKSYTTDYRKFKIGNILAIVKTIRENPGIKIDEILSICNVSDPFINKETAFGYLKDMIKRKKVNVDMKTKVVTICD